MNGPRLSLVMIAHNEAGRIAEALLSASGLVHEVILVDDLSQDGTVALAAATVAAMPPPDGAAPPQMRVYARRFDTPSRQMNFGIAHTAGDWIVLLDCDERLSPAMRDEIRHQVATAPEELAAVFFPRRNIIFGRWMRHGGNYPDYNHPRLLRRGRADFADHPAHPKIQLRGPAAYVRAPLIHLSYSDLRGYFDKLNRYTSGEADHWAAHGRRYSCARMWIAALGNLWRRGVLHQAWRDGRRGLLYLWLQFVYDLTRHLKLREATRRAAVVGAGPSAAAPSPDPNCAVGWAVRAPLGREPHAPQPSLRVAGTAPALPALQEARSPRVAGGGQP